MIGKTAGGRHLTIVVLCIDETKTLRAITGWDSSAAIRAVAQRRRMTYSQLIRAAVQEMWTPTVRVQMSEATLNFEISAPLPAQRIEFNYANEEQRPALRTGTYGFAR